MEFENDKTEKVDMKDSLTDNEKIDGEKGETSKLSENSDSDDIVVQNSHTKKGKVVDPMRTSVEKRNNLLKRQTASLSDSVLKSQERYRKTVKPFGTSLLENQKLFQNLGSPIGLPILKNQHLFDTVVQPLGSKVLRNQELFRKTMESFGPSILKNQHLFGTVVQPLGSKVLRNQEIFRKAMEPFGSSILKNQQLYRSIFEPLESTMLKEQAKFNKAFGPLGDTFIKNQELLRKAVEPLKRSLNVKAKEFEYININDINISDDGTISYSGECINIQDVANDINSFLQSDFNWQQRIANLINQYKKSAPVIFFIFFFVLNFFILGPIEEYYSQGMVNKFNNIVKYLQENKGASQNLSDSDFKSKFINEIKSEMSDGSRIKEMLYGYRFINTNILNVREGHSTKARVIGKLYLGQVVRIIEKNKEWILVEFIDEEKDIYIKGWAFSKYAKKFE